MPNYGYVRVAAAVPRVTVADPSANIEEMVRLAQEAAAKHVQLLVFPELGITGYTCGDLFHQRSLQEAAMDSFLRFVDTTGDLPLVAIVGMPLRVDDQLFNVAVVCNQGRILAVVPKTYLPGYKEFYEPRWFAPSAHLQSSEMVIAGQSVPVGTDIIIEDPGIFGFRIGVEICEDLWMPMPPSSRHAVNGAVIMANLSASNGLVGKADYRRELVNNQSARCVSGYLYASCGVGESSADVVFDGHAIIADNGTIVAESERFARTSQLVVTDIDVERLGRERSMTGSFGQSVAAEELDYRSVSARVRTLDLETDDLIRTIEPHPFVPSDPATRDDRSEEVFALQTAGLVQRLEHLLRVVGKREVVIGVSGGLDSTLALLVTVRAFDALDWDRKGIIAVTMPGFGTTDRTYQNAAALIRALGVTFREIPIRDAVLGHLKDIDHDPDLHCHTCQNAQARERTQILMDLGFVIGTGDLSEIALGWSTFNGDHMSMYDVNAGVPKTLVRHVIHWVAAGGTLGEDATRILLDVLATPISPELTPPEDGKVQATEELIGPYNLHDFFLFHMMRNGFGPAKVVFLTERAFMGQYDRATIVRWLREFYRRFFAAQFKRNAMPDGPKVGSVALSQRGDWRMPSDIQGTLWLRELDELKAAA